MARPLESRELALACAKVADEKKAEDIVILEVGKLIVITDYFVIATGESRKQLQAIADAICEQLRARGAKRYGMEGYEEGKWILLDYGDTIVHLFDRETRSYYDLEMIWGDAPRLRFGPTGAPAKRAAARAPRAAEVARAGGSRRAHTPPTRRAERPARPDEEEE